MKKILDFIKTWAFTFALCIVVFSLLCGIVCCIGIASTQMLFMGVAGCIGIIPCLCLFIWGIYQEIKDIKEDFYKY